MSTNLRTDIAAGANEALARSTVYRLLSQLFAYPTAADVEQLRGEDLPLASATAAPLGEGVRAALDRLAATMWGTGLEELESAYHGVFSHVHSADCPAYETDYRAREIWRQSQELADLAGFYRAFGMEPAAERPDHVAMELEFMHLVTYKAAWALIQDDAAHAAVCRQAEEAFLADHVLKWVPDLAERVRALAGEGVYAAAALLLVAFLREEARRFGFRVGAEGIEPGAVGAADREVEETALCDGGEP